MPPRPPIDRDLASPQGDRDPRALRPSKSQRKREMTALQELGEELVAQSREFLDQAPLPERLRDAIDHARSITDHEGRRRQMQFIGKLMREVEAEPIREMLSLTHSAQRRAAAHLHEVEEWRDRLLVDESAFAALGARLGERLNADRLNALRELAAEARAERIAHRAPHHYRDLFRQLNRLFSLRETKS